MIRRRTTGFLAAFAAFAVLAAPASADRNITQRFATNTKGAIAHTGNTLMTCPDSVSTCADARAGNAANTSNLNNNAYSMVYVDVDTNSSTFNSSTARLNIPDGSTILFAGLYYSGQTANGNEAARANTLVDTPAPGGYVAVTANQIDNFDASAAGQRIYGGFADITNLVQAGGSGDYTVANVLSSLGADRHAGWSIVVAYENANEKPRNLSILDGLIGINPNDADKNFTVSGFLTASSGPVNSDLGLIVYEGDLGLVGDSVLLDGVALSDANNPATNFNNSTISFNGNHFQQKNPNYRNQLGVDNDIINADGRLTNNQTSAQITLRTSGDRWVPQVITFQPEILAPDIPLQKEAVDLNGGLLRPGDVVEYRISGTNEGLEAAKNVVLTDPIPSNMTYQPNSLNQVSGANSGTKTDATDADQAEYRPAQDDVRWRIGTGANGTSPGRLALNAGFEVRFRVTVDAGTAPFTDITNVATLDYTGDTTNLNYGVDAPATVQVDPQPQIALQKTGPADAVHGDTVTYTFAATNPSQAPLSGVSLNDPNCSPVTGPVKTGGDQDELLEPGETWTFQCARQVPPHSAGEQDPLQNQATVTGSFKGIQASASDGHSVDIVHPSINIDTTGPAEVVHGGNVPLTYTVTTDGDPVAGVSVSDPDCSPVTGPVKTGGDQDNLLEQGETWTYQCTRAVPPHSGNEEDPIVQTGFVSGTVAGRPVTDSDPHSADILHPELRIEKTGPAVVQHGGQMTFDYAVTQDGAGSVTNVAVTDDKCSPVTGPVKTGGDQDDELETGETWTFTCTTAVPAHSGAEDDPIVNTATVTGTVGGSTFSDSDNHSTDIAHPQIALAKTAPNDALHGDTITYRFFVTNAGDVPLTTIGLADPDCSPVTGPVKSGGNQDNVLDLGETWAYECQRTVPPHAAGEADPLTNTATATGVYNGTDVSDDGTASTDLIHPNINLEKTGPATAVHGNDVAYEFQVTTTGDPVAGVALNDPDCSPITGPVKTGGDQDALLEQGETWTYGCSRAVPAHTEGENDPLLNQASVSGSVAGRPVSDSDGHSVDILHPQLNVEKTGPAGARHGEQITYSIAATNSGDAPFSGVVASDPDCSPISAPVKTGGDQDVLLEPGETWTYQCTRTVPPHSSTELDPLPNTATVTGTAGGQSFSDSDGHAVDLQHPEISITKTAPDEAVHGETITYGFEVKATGDVPLSTVTVADPDCSPITGPVKTGGNQDNTLEQGETWTYGCDRVIGPHANGETDPIVNEATATGTFRGQQVSDSGQAETNIIHPEIRVEKDGPAAVLHGDSMTFTYRVTEEGQGSLQNVTIEDDRCSPVTGPVKTGGDQDNRLEDGEVWTYECTRAVPPHSSNEADPFVNVATVRGTVNGVGFSDSDNHSTDIGHPRITLDKTAPAAVVHGQIINYTMTATNPGDVPLRNVTLNDRDCSPVSAPTKTGGNQDDLFDPGETWTWECSKPVPPHSASEDDPIVNRATVTGRFLGTDFDASDSAESDIEHPNDADISLEKDGSTSVAPDGRIGYTLTARNLGPRTGQNVTITDTLPANTTFLAAVSSPNCSASGLVVTCLLGDIPNGESRTVGIVIDTPPSLAGQTLTNAATVTADGRDPDLDNNDDTHNTTIRPATDLSITKDAPATALTGNQLTYSLAVTNGGPNDATGVTVTDTLPTGTTFASVSSSQGSCTHAAGTVTCNLGAIANGGGALVTIRVDVANQLAGQSVTNTASVDGNEDDLDPSDNTDDAETDIESGGGARADLEVNKTITDGFARVGNRLTYRVDVTNNGPDPATNVRLTDVVDSSVNLISVSTNRGTCTNAGFPVTCSLGRMNPGQTARIIIVVELVAEGRLVNNASGSSSETDPNPDNNDDDATAIVDVARTQVDLTKKASEKKIGPGEKFSYAIVFKNFGPGDAHDVEICDRLPAELIFVKAPDGGVYSAGRREVCWERPIVAEGERVRLKLVVRAADRLPDKKRVRNLAIATGSNFQQQKAAAYISCGRTLK